MMYYALYMYRVLYNNIHFHSNIYTFSKKSYVSLFTISLSYILPLLCKNKSIRLNDDIPDQFNMNRILYFSSFDCL